MNSLKTNIDKVLDEIQNETSENIDLEVNQALVEKTKEEIKKTFTTTDVINLLKSKEETLLNLQKKAKEIGLKRIYNTGVNCIGGGFVGLVICVLTGLALTSSAGVGIPLLGTIAGAIGSELLTNKDLDKKEVSVNIKNVKKEIMTLKKEQKN